MSFTFRGVPDTRKYYLLILHSIRSCAPSSKLWKLENSLFEEISQCWLSKTMCGNFEFGVLVMIVIMACLLWQNSSIYLISYWVFFASPSERNFSKETLCNHKTFLRKTLYFFFPIWLLPLNATMFGMEMKAFDNQKINVCQMTGKWTFHSIDVLAFSGIWLLHIGNREMFCGYRNHFLRLKEAVSRNISGF